MHAGAPATGDLVVVFTQESGDYWVGESGTNHKLAGPFARDSYAIGVARVLAAGRGAAGWIDRDGTVARVDDEIQAAVSS